MRCHSLDCYMQCRCTDRCPPSSHAGSSECGCADSESPLKTIHTVSLIAAVTYEVTQRSLKSSTHLTWALHHSEVVFGPHHCWVRRPSSITEETDRRTHISFLISQIIKDPCSLKTYNQNQSKAISKTLKKSYKCQFFAFLKTYFLKHLSECV